MKKFFLSILVLSVICLGAQAQKTKLNGYALYVFDDKVDSYYDNNNYFDGKIKGGLLWGLGLEYAVRPEYGIELSYLRQDTKAPMTYLKSGLNGNIQNTEFDMALNWVMLGGIRYSLNNPKVHPYGGLMLGAVFIDVKNPKPLPGSPESGSTTKFAWGFRGGVNINASERIGIKLQTQIMSAVQAVGGGVYFGTGGAGAGVSSYSSMLQFGLGGGIVINFGGGTTATHNPPPPPTAY